jgi:hypothetical protein
MAKQTINKIPEEASSATTDKSLQDYINEFDMTPPEYGYSFLTISKNGSTGAEIFTEGYTMPTTTGMLILKKYDKDNNATASIFCAGAFSVTINCVSGDSIATPFGDITKYSVEPTDITKPITVLTFNGKSSLLFCAFGSSAFASLLSTGNMFNSCFNMSTPPILPNSWGSINTAVSMFVNCYSMATPPILPNSWGSITNASSMFANCYSMAGDVVLPADIGLITDISSMFNSDYDITSISNFTQTQNIQINSAAYSIRNYLLTAISHIAKFSKIDIKGAAGLLTAIASIDIDYANSLFAGSSPQIDFTYNSLPKAELERIFALLPYIAAGKTMAITGNIGADTLISKSSSGTTADSVNVTMANTSSLAVGMEVYGTGLDTAISCTVQTDVNTITKAAHGLQNGMIVSFATIVTSTGFTVYRPYFVVNKTDNTFQISLTDGGAAIDLTGSNGSGTYLTQPTIASIDANVKIVLDRPASATGTVTVTAGVLKRSIAKFKKWTLTN